jgi:hypothetical protein
VTDVDAFGMERETKVQFMNFYSGEWEGVPEALVNRDYRGTDTRVLERWVTEWVPVEEEDD